MIDLNSTPDWSKFKATSLNPTQAFSEAASRDTGASARNSELAGDNGSAMTASLMSRLPGHGASKHPAPFVSPPVTSRRDNCGEPGSRFFIHESAPTDADRNVGLSVFLALSIGSAVSIFYLSYRIAEIVFGVRV